MVKEKKKIVILGGGFGGLYSYKSLQKEFNCKDISVTIVNRTNYFLFTPLLHEVATGSIAHHQVVESIRQLIYKSSAKLHVAEVLSVDCDKQIVKTSIAELPYDVLIMSMGATTNFFNTPGAQENSLVLKDLSDAIKLRNRFIDAFEKASEIRDKDERRQLLSFAIVGGGATGVELVAEAADLFRKTFSKYYEGLIDSSDVSLYLINRDHDILTPFHATLRKKALKTLRKMGVYVMINTAVKEVRKDSLVFINDTVLPVSHVVWTAGVKPNPSFFTHEAQYDVSGRVVVDSTLRIADYDNVFILGDMASMQGPNGKSLPMLAQVAEKQGLHTGGNIKRLFAGKKLLPFVYESQGELASLGRWHAVANLKGILFYGAFAWIIWRVIYLSKFISGAKRLKITNDWIVDAFYPRDITRS